VVIIIIALCLLPRQGNACGSADLASAALSLFDKNLLLSRAVGLFGKVMPVFQHLALCFLFTTHSTSFQEDSESD